MLGDTIAAVSTPRGKGGVALLRVSGEDAVRICSRVFLPKNGKDLSDCPLRTAIYGKILAPGADGTPEAVDDGLATVFRAPASFTGEDTVEICCHGGILLTQTVLTALLGAGARAAEAGEFTRRAFLNGKMGLSSAEALGNILEAQTREQLTLAHNGMKGAVEEKCREIYNGMKDILSAVYVKIDYPDEDLAEMSREEILDGIEKCITRTEALERTYRTGHAIAEGIRTVICGRPNVGKSSVYNRIVGHDAAIVTDVEGTTRDILSETAALGKVTLRLTDTAGLHESGNPVERIGIERARSEMENAELILAVFDAGKPLAEEDRDLIRTLENSPATVVALLNKSDLPVTDTAKEIASVFSHTVAVSAATGEGMDRLAELVEALFTDGLIRTGEDAVLTNARQHSAALLTLEALRRMRSALIADLPLDLCCTDGELAMEAISELDGRAVSEDIISGIFSRFCVGK